MARMSLAALIAAALLGFPNLGHAAGPEQLTIPADDGAVTLMRYPAHRDGRRPAVLVLHGSRGIELKPRAYQRYAERLAAGGMDVYLVNYFTAADHAALAPNVSTSADREVYEAARYPDWAKRISAMLTAILSRPDCSGNVGLLGFSLGGFVAAQTAADDRRVRALVVMYGGMPNARVAQVQCLPPLLELHGDADRNVSPARGVELVALAKRLDGPAEQVSYPGRAHGFDFSDTDPMASDAIGRVVRFFQIDLGSVPP